MDIRDFVMEDLAYVTYVHASVFFLGDVFSDRNPRNEWGWLDLTHLFEERRSLDLNLDGRTDKEKSGKEPFFEPPSLLPDRGLFHQSPGLRDTGMGEILLHLSSE